MKKAKRVNSSTESQQGRETLRKKYPNLEKLLLEEPGASPWFQRQSRQVLTTPRGGPLSWVAAPEDAYGPLVLHLVNSQGHVVGIVQSDTIVKQVESTRLMVSYETRTLDDWHRDPTNSNALDISILRIDDLHPIEDPLAQYRDMETQKRQFVIAGTLESHCAVALKVSEGIHSHFFPDDFKSFDELLHVSEYLPLQRLPGQQEDVALFVLRPKKDEYEVFPQDWYNLERWDSMYMFPNKAVRDRISGRIFITGMRIGEHILDQSNRRLEGEIGLPVNNHSRWNRC